MSAHSKFNCNHPGSTSPGQSLFNTGMTPPEFAKRINGVNCQRINQELARRKWLYSDIAGSWRVNRWAMGRYLTERHHNIERSSGLVVVRSTPVLLEKGAAVIYSLYLSNELPMKRSWNGEFTENETLLGAA